MTLDEAFHGTRRVLEREDGRKIDAKIPPGVKTASRVRLKGHSGPGGGGGDAGDLYLTIEALPDKRFQRDDDDLRATVPVDLFTMLLGGKVSVAGLDRAVMLDIPPETPAGIGAVHASKRAGKPEPACDSSSAASQKRMNPVDGAAAILGLHPSALRARMHKLGILRSETKQSD